MPICKTSGALPLGLNLQAWRLPFFLNLEQLYFYHTEYILFLKHLIAAKEGIFLKFLDKSLNFIGSLFAFEKNYKDENLEKKKLLLSNILFYVLAGIALGISEYIIINSKEYSESPFHEFIVSSAIAPDYYPSLQYIIKFVLIYGSFRMNKTSNFRNRENCFQCNNNCCWRE